MIEPVENNSCDVVGIIHVAQLNKEIVHINSTNLTESQRSTSLQYSRWIATNVSRAIGFLNVFFPNVLTSASAREIENTHITGCTVIADAKN